MKRLHALRDHFLKNRFNHLLIIVLGLFITSPFLQTKDATTFSPIAPLIYTIAVVAILRTLYASNREFYFFSGLKIGAFLLDILVYYELIHVLGEQIHMFDLIVRISLFVLFIYHIIKELFMTEKVSADTIKGGICVYIFIGILWGQLYKLTYDIDPSSFSIPFGEHWGFFHFSFNTLTTVGYGVITPVSSFAMMLTNLEGLVGLLFLVLFLARLVGLHIIHSSDKTRH